MFRLIQLLWVRLPELWNRQEAFLCCFIGNGMQGKSSFCSIIIPVFNQYIFTRQCLDSLFRCTESGLFELLLVDNGSSDDTQSLFDQCQQSYQQVQVLRFEENRGYTVANNEAARRANGDYLMFLNNDTILTSGWLSALLDAADSQQASVVGSKLVYPHTNNINHAGYVYNNDIRLYYPIYHQFWSENPVVNKQRVYQGLLGAAFLVEKNIFWQVGGFEDYGLEDLDLCLKVREQGGRVVYCPASKVYHYGSVTISNTNPRFLPQRTSEMFNKRWPFEGRLWDDLGYYGEDGFEVGDLSSENITLWRRDNRALKLSLEASEARLQGDLQRARCLVEESCQADPRCKEVLMYRTKILSELEDIWGVINSLMELVALDPLYYEGYILVAQYLGKFGHVGEALNLLEAIAAKDDLPFDIAEQVTQLIGDYS